MTGAVQETQSKTRKITLIVLGVVMAGTVFLLPNFVDKPWVGDTAELPTVSPSSSTAVAPSTAAELTRYRQESQRVLAEIMTLRERLEEKNVSFWAAPDFQQALGQVEAGDEHYSYGDYAESLEQFRQARDRLIDIESMGQQKLADAKSEAETAIEALNVPVALSSVELASAIAPGDSSVRKLTERAGKLEQVARHIEAGDRAIEHDRYEVARKEYATAVELDPLHQRANRSLAEARSGASANVYRDHMTRGFTALEQGAYERARSAFLDAGRARPGDPAVAKALDQVENRESLEFVNAELARAEELESREAWSDALAIYESLLKQDPSLTQAKVRLIPARVRADLDERLSRSIEDPYSLSSQSAYTAAQSALADAKSIPNPGPLLRQQTGELETLLQRANTAVNVLLQSDNQTHVVLYRVADLGRFDRKSVKLRPGKYVAAGTRTGYRDVRVEFTVTGQADPPPVVVRCEEPIG